MWNDKSVLPDKEYDWGILVYYETSEPKFLRVENYDPNDPAGVEKWAYQKDIIQLQEENNRYKRALEIAKSYVKGISQMVINSGDNIYIVIGHFKKLAEQTLEQIEHKDE